MYGDILVPTDGSDASLDALVEAATLAAHHDATIHVLYVVDLRRLGDVDSAALVDALEASGQEAVEQARTRAREEGIESVETAIHRGTPYRAILEYVDQHDVDLVVMGTHGRTGLNRLLLGSVTEKVVRLSPVPVLTVRPERDEETDAEPPAEGAPTDEE